MMLLIPTLLTTLLAASSSLACDDCTGQQDVVQTRNVRPRSQPGVPQALSGPKGPLSWGQINFIHTTDTHGWLEGHLKQQNYGADWGDFVSFTKYMKSVANGHGVDLLLIDTGDLHDGAGLSDATFPDGVISNPIFENIDYDILTIGNHELYLSSVAYEQFQNFSVAYGDRYLTSNVQILNPATNTWQYIGKQYRYFTTAMGMRIMAFGVLFNFASNTNVTLITPAAIMITQDWFINAVQYSQPVDLFILTGHNVPRGSASSATLTLVYQAIRKMRPDVPIQVFGGHSHIRDFVVYDQMATGLESGRYCETAGWLAVSGINTSAGAWNPSKPLGLPHPTQPAVVVAANSTATVSNSSNGLTYFRRYLDWNRRTFEYHTNISHPSSFGSAFPFDQPKGINVTQEIYTQRQNLNLTAPYGCARQSWCISCAPFMSSGNIFSLLSTALATVVVNPDRANNSRIIYVNTGNVRFDLSQGLFTYDDAFIVSPFINYFQYIPNVPYNLAVSILPLLNTGSVYKRKRDPDAASLSITFPTTLNPSLDNTDTCTDPSITSDLITGRSYAASRIVRRQTSLLTAGYKTTDDFGSNGDGDDTPHLAIPSYAQPHYFSASANFPSASSTNSSSSSTNDTTTTTPEVVDLVFLNYFAAALVGDLVALGGNYSLADVGYYMPVTFSTQDYLPAYVKVAEGWRDVGNCSVSATGEL